jgi:hypothetical protein
VRRLASTLLFVAGYWVMACLDGPAAFFPAVSAFAVGTAMLVLPALRTELET